MTKKTREKIAHEIEILNGKLSRLENFARSFEKSDETSRFQLTERLKSLDDILSKFETTQFEKETLGPSPSDEDDREIFESRYFVLKESLLSLQEKNFPTSTNPIPGPEAGAQGKNVKLPSLELPSFDGQYDQWLHFRDTFLSVIDQNSNLSRIDKLHYLVSCLKGEAANLIESLELSGQNYTVAWDLLKARFENKKLLVYRHIQAIFDVPEIEKESLSALRNLSVSVSKHLRALQSLDQKIENWDSILICVITSKLDITSKRAWESESTSSELPTYKQMSEFLDTRCRMLESCYDATVSTSMKPNKAAHIFLGSTDNQPKFECPVCKKNHYIHQCPEFLALSPNERIEQIQRLKWCFNCLRSGHFTLQCKWKSSCQKCSNRHNTLLHIDQTSSNNAQNISAHPIESPSATLSNFQANTEVILATALVVVMDSRGKPFTCRALLDSGSQSNLMTVSLARALGLQQYGSSRAIRGVGERIVSSGRLVRAMINSRHNAFNLSLEFSLLDKITGELPHTAINIEQWQIPKNITLADEEFNLPRKIDLLIGAQSFFDLLCVGQFKLSKDSAVFQKTILGWIVSGCVPHSSSTKSIVQHTVCHLAVESHLDSILERFWNQETIIGDEIYRTDEEDKCEQHFVANTIRNSSGRFEVSLPFKTDPASLKDSKQIAERRFFSLEKRFARDARLKEQYISFLNEYLELGHMELLPDKKKNLLTPGYHLPHHPVLKQESTTTKLRVVFDGSAHWNSSTSLNQNLMVGPTIQRELFSIIISFRLHRYVMTADIKQMYRQILVKSEHRDFQKILWRDEPTDEFKTFRLTTVTYGLSCSPFLAIRCLHELADRSQLQYPLAARITKSDFYVDDLMTGSNSLEVAKAMQLELVKMLRSAGLQLRKWCSNTSKLMQDVPSENNDPHLIVNVEDGEAIKTLGLSWNPNEDCFILKVNPFAACKPITKRNILSETAQLFDPLGLVSPVIIRAKILMQEIWKLKVDWDETVPANIYSFWKRFRNELIGLNELRIPRRVISNDRQIEIHGFCDASTSAYGACLYLRSCDEHGVYSCQLLCSKSRVAPVKQISLPRLELSGALLLSELYHKVKPDLEGYEISRVNFWTDSTVTLCWIQKSPSFWKTFVANRVSKIHELTNPLQWKHIRGNENPADIVSRGCTVSQITSRREWFHGPAWLSQNDSWPEYMEVDIDNYPEERKFTNTVLINTEDIFDLASKFSSLSKLKRITALCLRLIHNLRSPPTCRRYGPITIPELRQGLRRLIRQIQIQYFHSEWHALTRNQSIKPNSTIRSLCPIYDSNQVIRVGGRLAHSNLKQKHPILLPHDHFLTKLIAKDIHIQTMHSGPQALLSSIRLEYWPIKGKVLCKSIVKHCLNCFKVKPRGINPQMGQLPPTRVCPSTRPFINSGLDFCGPILVRKMGNKRAAPIKGYICVFICMATKAIHIELVSDLSTDSFIAAVKRFMGRRGKCANIYCDNGTNFVGANRKLKELRQEFLADHSQSYITASFANQDVKFNFIPPRSPHFGGLWEAGVKTVKHYLFRSVGAATFNFEELNTLLIQIEACVNSRPLTPISDDPTDLLPLTPSHFLIGDVLIGNVEPDLTTENMGRLKRWQLVQQQMQQFWKRWSSEYLTTLQQRTKWTKHSEEIKLGAMVLIKDDFRPPLHWPVGRVEALHPGTDGICRVVTVRTNNGLFKRAVANLCPLPVEH